MRYEHYNRSKMTMLTWIGIFMAMSHVTNAQNCSVNAGVDDLICINGNMNLYGNQTGLFTTNAQWSLVSGPNTPTIVSPTSLNTAVTGFNSGVYTFRISALCQDSVAISDDVKITVQAMHMVFAGNDTTFCYNTPGNLNASLGAGQSGNWLYQILTPTSVYSLGFMAPTSKNSGVLTNSWAPGCPKQANCIWTVTSGPCINRDTVKVSFLNQLVNTKPPFPDASICGISYSFPNVFWGCGGNYSVIQLSGPSLASISNSTGNVSSNSYGNAIASGLVKGTYTFAYHITGACSGDWRDTMTLTVTSTVNVSNPGITILPGQNLCPSQFDTAYYMSQMQPLLPGETATWGYVYSAPYSLPAPTIKTMNGGTGLKITNITHPDSNSTDGYYQYTFSYTVSNGTCSQSNWVSMYFYPPIKTLKLASPINLPCNATSGNIVQAVAPSNLSGYSFILSTLSKPAGAPAPVLAFGSNIASNLVPGKYVFQATYSKNAGCGNKSAIIEVYVSATGTASNAGTDQLLPCGTDSTFLAGNIPLAGKGTWQLVSGPGSVILTNPNSASLQIKNLSPGNYVFRWSINNGNACPVNSDVMNVIVTTTPQPASAGPDRALCYGSTVYLRGNSPKIGTTGMWSQVSGSSVTINNPASPYATVTGTSASSVYEFEWVLTNPCGTTRDTVKITTGSSQGPSDAVIITPDQCLSAATTSIMLTATAPAVGTGRWRQLSGPGAATIVSPTSNSSNVTGLLGGVYLFVWEVNNGSGCDTTRDTVSAARLTSALVSNAGADIEICATGPLNLNATAPLLGTGLWTQTGGGGTVIVNPSLPNTTVTGYAPGSYDYRWTVSLGVCTPATDDVHVTVYQLPSAAKAMRDTLICGISLCATCGFNLSISAQAPVSGTGAWSILQSPYATSLPGSSSPNITGTFYGGITKLQWQVVSGVCPSTKDTVKIEIVPRADVGAPSYSYCQQSFISLPVLATGAGSGTAAWSQVRGPNTAVISTTTSPSPVFSNLIAGSYTFRYDVSHPVSGCSSFDTVMVINSTMPANVNAGRDTTVCYAGSTRIPLKASVPSAGSGVWGRSVGSGNLSFNPGNTSNNTIATVDAPGLQQFVWTVSNGACTARDYVDAVVEKLPVPTIGLTGSGGCKDTVTAVAPFISQTTRYDWTFYRGIRDSIISGLGLNGPVKVSYSYLPGNWLITLKTTDPATGCFSKDSTPYQVLCVLPVKLLSFDAQWKQRDALLHWVTVAEENCRYFELQRSTDGLHFRPIGQQLSKARGGNSMTDLAYSFTDVNAFEEPADVLYYRFKQVDYNGEYSYSPVKALLKDGADGSGNFRIWPNPVTGNSDLQVMIASTTDPYPATLNIIDGTGKTVLVQNINIDEGENKIALPLSELNAGVYYLQFKSRDAVVVKPFIKAN